MDLRRVGSAGVAQVPFGCHTPCMSERINARLDAGLAKKLAHLQARTGKSTTELIRASIESYYDRVVQTAGPRALLDDFVGCASAEPELSESYKAVFAESIGRKLDDASKHVQQMPATGVGRGKRRRGAR